MQFTIVGAGALGTILGAHLGAAGHAVTVLARGARAQQAGRDGLRVQGLRDLHQRCTVLSPQDCPREPGVLVLAVKTYHMAEALAPLVACRPQAVFSLANGVLKGEQLAESFGASRVLGCMANFSGELLADGNVAFSRNVRLALGAAPGYAGTAVQDIAAAIDGAGLVTVAVPDIESAEWSKFVGWVALFALAVIARATTGEFLANPRFATLGVRLVREAHAVASARGIRLVDASPVPVAAIATQSFEQAVKTLRETGAGFQANAPGHRMSALQDLEAGRALEVHETLGYVVAEARRLGVPAATLELCYEIAAGLNDLPRQGTLG